MVGRFGSIVVRGDEKKNEYMPSQPFQKSRRAGKAIHSHCHCLRRCARSLARPSYWRVYMLEYASRTLTLFLIVLLPIRPSQHHRHYTPSASIAAIIGPASCSITAI